MDISPNDCAREVLDVVPLVMRAIRAEFRSNRLNDLSVPQFRTLGFINRNTGAPLSDLAEHLGMTAPSASKLVDGLVDRGLVERQLSNADRRRITLGLTEPGRALLEASYRATQECFAELFAGLSEAERTSIVDGMHALRRIFTGEVVPNVEG